MRRGSGLEMVESSLRRVMLELAEVLAAYLVAPDLGRALVAQIVVERRGSPMPIVAALWLFDVPVDCVAALRLADFPRTGRDEM